MKKRRRWLQNFFFSFFCMGILFLFAFSIVGRASENKTKNSQNAASSGEKRQQNRTIVLDAGHGGTQDGAVTKKDGEEIFEKDLNLKIAKYLQEELLKYEDVTVIMTREEDVTRGLEFRATIAKMEEADLFVSLHNNAKGEIAYYGNGCTVLTPKGQYHPELTKIGQTVGVNILYELSQLGIENQGLLLRTSETGATYPNGELADYYGLIYRGVLNEIPTIIIEHAFLDNNKDYETYLSDDEKLRKLAQADARGIVRYYQLRERETGEVLDMLENIKTSLVWVKDGKAENNEISEKVFYESEVTSQELVESSVTEEETETTERDDTSEVRESETTLQEEKKESSMLEKIFSKIQAFFR